MNKHVTFHPETGQEATRNSKNRTYTHAIWVQIPWEWRVRALENEVKHNREQAVEYRAVIADVEAGRPISDPRSRESHEKWGWTVENEWLPWAESCERRAESAQAEADRIREAQEDEPWGVVGWAGRPDLAEKRAASEAKNGWRTLITEAIVS